MAITTVKNARYRLLIIMLIPTIIDKTPTIPAIKPPGTISSNPTNKSPIKNTNIPTMLISPWL